MTEFFKISSKHLANVFSLSDLELSKAIYELDARCEAEYKNANELIATIANKETYNKEAVLERITAFYLEG